jgi:hypothetical protein
MELRDWWSGGQERKEVGKKSQVSSHKTMLILYRFLLLIPSHLSNVKSKASFSKLMILSFTITGNAIIYFTFLWPAFHITVTASIRYYMSNT